jgi:ribosome-associated heat shock protein Hsp15
MITRIDQWLWAARLFKTRTMANQACRGGRVQIAGKAVKPAHPLRAGEVVCIKQAPIVRQYLVKNLAVKRVSAVLARELVEEITPAADLEKLALARRDPLGLIFAAREKGSGRPTKRERRHLEKFIDQTPKKHDNDTP